MDDFFFRSENSMPRIGDYAPAFRAVTTQGTIYFPADYFGKWVILFSYPTDSTGSTPVTTSEFLAFANMHNGLKELNCELIGLPIDRLHSRTAGLSSIKEKIKSKGTKEIEIKFPVIEDVTTEVARKYGIIKSEKDTVSAVRAVFFIDQECMIRTIIYYPLSLGLNFDELKRVIVALQTEDNAISPPTKSFCIAKEHIVTIKEGKKSNGWFFCTRELTEEKVMNVN